MTYTTMPANAVRALFDQCEYDLAAVLEGWDRMEYGDLHDSATGEKIRQATQAEAVESLTAGPEGHIEVAGRDCYVSF